MRYAYTLPLVFGLGALAGLLPRDTCCFELVSYPPGGGASGPLGQIKDGQIRVNDGCDKATFCLDKSTGSIHDDKGRGCIIASSSQQFQCDTGAKPSTGFAVEDGKLTKDDYEVFWSCPVNDAGVWNIYLDPIPGEKKCVRVLLHTEEVAKDNGLFRAISHLIPKIENLKTAYQSKDGPKKDHEGGDKYSYQPQGREDKQYHYEPKGQGEQGRYEASNYYYQPEDGDNESIVLVLDGESELPEDNNLHCEQNYKWCKEEKKCIPEPESEKGKKPSDQNQPEKSRCSSDSEWCEEDQNCKPLSKEEPKEDPGAKEDPEPKKEPEKEQLHPYREPVFWNKPEKKAECPVFYAWYEEEGTCKPYRDTLKDAPEPKSPQQPPYHQEPEEEAPKPKDLQEPPCQGEPKPEDTPKPKNPLDCPNNYWWCEKEQTCKPYQAKPKETAKPKNPPEPTYLEKPEPEDTSKSPEAPKPYCGHGFVYRFEDRDCKPHPEKKSKKAPKPDQTPRPDCGDYYWFSEEEGICKPFPVKEAPDTDPLSWRPDPQCDEGSFWCTVDRVCKPHKRPELGEQPTCPNGYVWSWDHMKCISFDRMPKAFCAPGWWYDEETRVCKPIEAREPSQREEDDDENSRSQSYRWPNMLNLFVDNYDKPNTPPPSPTQTTVVQTVVIQATPAPQPTAVDQQPPPVETSEDAPCNQKDYPVIYNASPVVMNSCPLDLAGAPEFDWTPPHEIIPISCENPKKAYGSTFFPKICPKMTTLYNFDLPERWVGRRCTLEFFLPHQRGKEALSYDFKSPGAIDFRVYQKFADPKTTYERMQYETPLLDAGAFEIKPGSAYVIHSHDGDCPGGKSLTVEASSVQGLNLEYFQDSGKMHDSVPLPGGLHHQVAPVGLYVRAC